MSPLDRKMKSFFLQFPPSIKSHELSPWENFPIAVGWLGQTFPQSAIAFLSHVYFYYMCICTYLQSHFSTVCISITSVFVRICRQTGQIFPHWICISSAALPAQICTRTAGKHLPLSAFYTQASQATNYERHKLLIVHERSERVVSSVGLPLMRGQTQFHHRTCGRNKYGFKCYFLKKYSPLCSAFDHFLTIWC